MYIDKSTSLAALQKVRRLPRTSVQYVKSLFPCLEWIPNYNRKWLISDIIAGVTVGIFVIPQCLAYSKLANLPLQFGLYSSFAGCLLYFLFGTSKDVTIGTTAVTSTLIGQLVSQHGKGLGLSPEEYAISLAFSAGFIELAIGLLRIADIVDLIPNPVMAGFTTGAVFGIVIGQISPLLGIIGIDKMNPNYRIMWDTFASLHRTKLDAIFGIVALLFLIFMRYMTKFMAKRGAIWFQWVGQSANFIAIVIFTLFSFLLLNNTSDPLIDVVGTVPRGFNYIALPNLTNLYTIMSHTPAVILLSSLELMAVAKSFGRLNRYNPDSNQEMIAIGVGNIVGSIFGSYSTTGAFSRSSIQSRAGSKTPLAGIFTAGMVFLAIFFITPIFKFIPTSVLAAMIINALYDLLSSIDYIKQLWRIDFNDFASFTLAMVITFFHSIEMAVYVSVLFSVLVVLYRVARPKVQVLVKKESSWVVAEKNSSTSLVVPAPPGYAVFRISESLTYLNNNYLFQVIRDWIRNNSKSNEDGVERQWNESKKMSRDDQGIWLHSDKQIEQLHCVILDFSGVNGVDASGLQTLIDIRRDVSKFAGVDVPFYFVHVRPDLRRVLDYFENMFRPVCTAQSQVTVDPESWVDLYASKDVYCQQFFCDTIDEAIDNAKQRQNSF